MKISDSGLEHILSLGLFKETGTPGLYRLYEWDGVTYYCGLSKKALSKKEGSVFITLSNEQFSKLPISKNKKEKSSELLNIFQNIIFIKNDKNKNLFNTSYFEGTHSKLSNISISDSKDSPFKIIKKTGLPFHGEYSPLEPLSSTFDSCFENYEKIWMSGVPVFKGDDFYGCLFGLSLDKEYGNEIIDKLYSYADKILLKESDSNLKTAS